MRSVATTHPICIHMPQSLQRLQHANSRCTSRCRQLCHSSRRHLWRKRWRHRHGHSTTPWAGSRHPWRCHRRAASWQHTGSGPLGVWTCFLRTNAQRIRRITMLNKRAARPSQLAAWCLEIGRLFNWLQLTSNLFGHRCQQNSASIEAKRPHTCKMACCNLDWSCAKSETQ